MRRFHQLWQGAGPGVGLIYVNPSAGVVGRVEEREALQMVHVSVANQQVKGDDSFLFELETKLANPGARIEDNDSRSASHFDAGRVAATTQRGWARGRDRTPRSPKLNRK